MERADRTLFYLTAALVLMGLLVVSSASVAISERNFGTLYGYTLRHGIYALVLGGIAFFSCQRIPYQFWRKISLPLLLGSLILMMLVFFPVVGVTLGGAQRWITLCFFSFQPGELLKLTLIIYLSSWLDKGKSAEKTFGRALAPFTLILGIASVFLILQPDIGTLFIVAATASVLYFLGGGKVSQLFSLGFLGLIVIILLIQIAPYRVDRLTVFLDPNTDPTGIGYQIRQAFIAIGSGGVFGRGFGQGIQKYNYLPEPINDSIFAIITEELGFAGASAIIALFLLFAWCGMRIAREADTFFGKLLAAGITSGIIIQAFINMAAISGLLPLTGIPLPFISYGGTSLVMTLASIGILRNISTHA